MDIHARTPWIYYGIQAQPGHEVINLRALDLIGNVDLYVRRCTRSTLRECARLNLPSLTNYTTNSADLYYDVLKIHRNDNEASLYIVGVYSTSFYSAFQMSYGFENTILELQAGIAVTDHAFEREFDYFAFYVSSPNQILKVTLTTVQFTFHSACHQLQSYDFSSFYSSPVTQMCTYRPEIVFPVKLILHGRASAMALM